MRHMEAFESPPYNRTIGVRYPGILVLRPAAARHARPPMKNVNKSVLIWYSPEEMFALVTDVAKYPEFLPWCDSARVLEQDEHGMTAEVGIAFSGLRKSFVTRNQHEPGRRVQMRLVKGPFSQLDGDWRLPSRG